MRRSVCLPRCDSNGTKLRPGCRYCIPREKDCRELGQEDGRREQKGAQIFHVSDKYVSRYSIACSQRFSAHISSVTAPLSIYGLDSVGIILDCLVHGRETQLSSAPPFFVLVLAVGMGDLGSKNFLVAMCGIYEDGEESESAGDKSAGEVEIHLSGGYSSLQD